MRKLLAAGVLLLGFVGVQAATFNGTVVDSVTGNPIIGAVVSVQTADMAAPVTATTNAAGAYSIAIRVVLVPVAYTEGVTAVGHTAKMVRGTITATLQIITRTFALAASTVGNIGGTVTDSSAATAIAGAKAMLYVLQVGPVRPRYVILDSTTTNAAGHYTFTGLASDGTYRVYITAATYTAKGVSAITVVAGITTTVNFQLVHPVVAVGGVEGIVNDTLTHEALVNAMVILTNSVAVFTPETTTTNIMGAYVFAGEPAGANYVVTGSMTNYYTKALNVTIPANDTVTANDSLRAYTATVHGTITNRTGGAAVADARVVLLSNNGAAWNRLDSIVSGADGSFQFSPLPADTYRVVVQAQGFYPDSSGDSIVINGENQVLNVSLVAVGRGTLHVKVSIDTAGFPAIAGATVYAVLAPGPVQQDTLVATTNAQGWVDIANAIEGNYTVSAFAGGFNTASTGRNLTNNEQDTGYILLARYVGATKTISGIVRVSGSGLPVSGAIVTLQLGLTTFRDTAIASGDYSITFPTSFSTGELMATAAGYVTWDSTVSLAAAATNKNINMQGATGAIARTSAKAAVSRVFVSGRNMLSVSAASVGTFSLFSLDGKLVMRQAVTAGQTVVKLAASTGRTLIAQLVTGNQVARETVVLR